MSNPYHYLFYIIYKFVKLTTKQELQNQVASSAHHTLFFGFTNFFLALVILTNPFRFITYRLSIFAFLLIGINILFFYSSRNSFIKNEKYKDIEKKYDQTNKLKKKHFIPISVLYMIGSIAALIYSGINYTG